MGMLLRLLLMKFLPARLAWVVAALILGKALAGRDSRAPRNATRSAAGDW